jgi:hypothetical protein
MECHQSATRKNWKLQILNKSRRQVNTTRYWAVNNDEKESPISHREKVEAWDERAQLLSVAPAGVSPIDTGERLRLEVDTTHCLVLRLQECHQSATGKRLRLETGTTQCDLCCGTADQLEDWICRRNEANPKVGLVQQTILNQLKLPLAPSQPVPVVAMYYRCRGT